MALLDFPSGPGSGDTYSLNGNTWKWNGTSWVAFNNLSLSTQVSGILAVQYGGTGFGGTYAIGDILYASASNAFTKLSAGTAGSVLASGGTGAAPYWKVDDSGTGSVGNGTSGGFAYYNGLNTITSGTAFSYINGAGAGGTGATVVLTQSNMALIGSTITSGTWAGSAITAKYGGTGLNALSAGDIIYGSATDTYSRLTHSGSAGSILVTVGSSGIAWTLGSSLTVGIANSLSTTTDTSNTLYLLGTRSNVGFAGTAIYVDSNISFSGNTITGNLTGTASIATSSVVLNTTADTTSTLYLLGTRTNGGFAGTALYVDTGISALGNTLSATTFVGSLTGTATTATRALNTDITLDTTSTIYITGSRSGGSIGSTPTYVLSGVSALGNTLSATTFVGALTGTASIATSVATNTDTSNTLYLLGSRTSTGVAATAIYVDSSISVVGNTITGNLTGTASIATSSVVLNTTADTTSTLYLLGTRSNGGFAGTAVYVDTGISALGNTITATTFSGVATSATRVGITTSVSTSDLPIVFADAHQPYAALSSTTLLTYQASTGKITNGIWAGTAITTRGGGTGFNTVNANQVLIGSSTGNTWTAIGSTLLPVAHVSATAPAQPGGAIGATQAGQLWWDSEFGVLKVYYADGTSNQWVDATPTLGSSGGGSSTKRSYVMTFGAGFTPSTGADTVQILIPYAPDNTSKYYYIKRLDYRANTAGTGVSFYIERFTGGNAAFDVSTGNRIHSASGASFVTSSGTFITSYTQSSSGASFVSSSGVAGSVISGDYLRLNFSHINSAALMSVSMIIEEQ